MARTRSCYVCKRALGENDRISLVRGRSYEEYCSDLCLHESLRRRRAAEAAARKRWLLKSVLFGLLVAGANTVWHRFHAQQPQGISFSEPEPIRPEPPPPGPPGYGPAWPPTDGDWTFAFERASWTYPLPGPIRRATAGDARIFGADPPRNHVTICRKEGHCGVDLGGDLWGEHVYAVLDGVVEHVQRTGNEDRGGQYVRLSHFGGMVFTQYFHLAATPRTLGRGDRVKAGDVIGLLGDTGLRGANRHLHFALSVRPSPAFSEVYWDPDPWMGRWALRQPARGTVAGLVPLERNEKERETPPRRRSK